MNATIPTPPRVFAMGACLLNGPLASAIKAGELSRAAIGRGGSTPGTYSFGEMFQLLDFLAGARGIPAEARGLCGYAEAYAAAPGAAGFTGADVCLIEPNGVVDIEWEGLKLNRAMVMAVVMTPIKALGREPGKLVNAWYNKGMLACNETARDEAVTALLPQLPAEMENRAQIVAVLARAHGVRRDVAADMAALAERIPLPIGVIAYAYQYLPDGRPVFWPADLREQVGGAAARLGLPFLEPWRLVQEHGGQPVLKPDLRHYAEDFIPTVATAIARFAGEVAQRVPAA